MAGKKTAPADPKDATGDTSKSASSGKPASKPDSQFVTERGVRMAVLGLLGVVVVYFTFPYASDWLVDYLQDDEPTTLAEAPQEAMQELDVSDEVTEPIVLDEEPEASDLIPAEVPAPEGLTEREQIPEETNDSLPETLEELQTQEIEEPALDEARVASLEAEVEALKTQLADQSNRPSEETMSLASALAAMAPPLYQSRTFVGELEQVRILVLGMPALDQATLATPVAILSEFSRKGVPGNMIIETAFKDASLQALREEGLTETSGWWARTWASIKGLVVVRRTDVADSATLEGSILKMEAALSEGDLRGALDILKTLKSDDAAAFEDWAKLTTGRVDALEAFETLVNFIPSGQGGPS